MTKKQMNNTILEVLNACANKYKTPVRPLGYDEAGILVDYATYLTHKLTSIIETPVVKGDLTFSEAKAMLRPFLWVKYIALGFSPDGNMWEVIAFNGDSMMFDAFQGLKEVCKK